jgi:hypothetical protein
MLKSFNNVKVMRKELIDYISRQGEEKEDEDVEMQDASVDSSQPLNLKKSMSKKPRGEISEGSSCFGCALNYAMILLNFVEQTSHIKSFVDFYIENNFVDVLYDQSLRMFSSKLRGPARKAICSIVKHDLTGCNSLLSKIESSILGQNKIKLPVHLTSQSLQDDVDILISLSQNTHELSIIVSNFESNL